MIELYELKPHKMTAPQEKAQCVSWFIETKSYFKTQRYYRSKYERDPPSGRPRTSEENIERVRQVFQRSPIKSIRTATRQLELTRSTAHRVSSILTSVVSLGLNI